MQTPSASTTDYFADFPAALRYWRDKRGFSQLQLSAIGSVSQRHLSFLESGRSQPSKELILKLGIALDIPLRQRNVMLLAAGFAPAYKDARWAIPSWPRYAARSTSCSGSRSPTRRWSSTACGIFRCATNPQPA